VSFKCFEVLLK
jgi:hypothetical protein